jgi:hypothetical protein
MDVYGDMGYAERYDFNGIDSSLKVMGVITLFGGTVNPASTKTVNFYTWNQGPEFMVSPTFYESGYPGIALDSVTVPITQLGIAASTAAVDTYKAFYFTTPTSSQYYSFFVGYTLNYNFSSLGGDTIALYTSIDGERTSPIITISGGDTIVNNQNLTMYNDGSWNDNATANFGLQNDFYIFPIVEVGIGNTAGVASITRKGLTFFGNYPNPAISNTNIRFSLATAADVNIIVTDMTGKTIKTLSEPCLDAGIHTINMSIEEMASGDYLYILHTSGGAGIAAKFTVVH